MDSLSTALYILVVVITIVFFTPVIDLVVYLFVKIEPYLAETCGLKAVVSPSEPVNIVLVGSLGKTLSDLLPSGIAEFNGERFHVQAEGKAIGKGEPIFVARIDGSRIYVEKEVSELPSADDDPESSRKK